MKSLNQSQIPKCGHCRQQYKINKQYYYRYNQCLRTQRNQIIMGARFTTKDVELKTIQIDLGERSYPIYIGCDTHLDYQFYKPHIRGKQVLIVTNTTIAPIYLEKLQIELQYHGLQVHTCILPDGEQYKNIEHIQKIWDAALNAKLDRKAAMIALGGGVIGDMTGFAAASYLRGIDFLQVPTSLMALVDSSVGGKTGVNHELGKNMIGAFHQPRAVIVDIKMLNSLPERQMASGLPEIIKYGLIRDADLFRWLQWTTLGIRLKEEDTVAEAVERSICNKRDVVQIDEREGGERAKLNLGHTFGHAIEAWQNYEGWLHGEAVSAGILMSLDLSRRMGWVSETLVKETQELVKQSRQPSLPPPGMTPDDFKRLMALDKKVEDGKIKLVLCKGELGNCVITSDYDPEKLDETLEAMCQPVREIKIKNRIDQKKETE